MKLGGRHQPNAWVQARGAQFQPHQHAKTRQNKVRKPVPHGQIPIRSGHQMSFSFGSAKKDAPTSREEGGQQVSRGTDGPQRVVLRVPAH